MTLASAILVDSTLREGLQTPGLYLSSAEQVELAQGIARVGIEELELGWGPDLDLGPLMRDLRVSTPRLRVSLWCRAKLTDISQATMLGPDALAVALPVSDLHISRRLGKDRNWALSQIPLLVEAARGLPLCLGLEDASRADRDFLGEICRHAARCGVERIRFADTVGVLTPSETVELIRIGLVHFGTSVGLHAHDDFGMATGNAITALAAGATRVDVSVLGVGERAGISRMEQVVAHLALRGGCDRYDTAALAPLCRLVAKLTGQPLAPRSPIVGDGIFTCESGIHVDGLLKDPETYEPFSPLRVGAPGRTLLVGAKSGRAAVRHALYSLGLASRDESTLDRVMRAVRETARRQGRALVPEELRKLVLEGASNPGARP